VLGVVGALFGLVAFQAGGCVTVPGQCSCPAASSSATIDLGCVPRWAPVVVATGPCTVCPFVPLDGGIPEGARCAVRGISQYIMVNANAAGACHVEWTFPGGATSSIDLVFASEWRACGSDPHGCGEGLAASPADAGSCLPSGCQVPPPESVCGAAMDAETSQ
jgi:hypothetical protein